MPNDEIPKDTQDLISKSLTYVKDIFATRDMKDYGTLAVKLQDKNIAGYKKYWEFKFEDNNMYQMAEEEILDAINYMCYELIKLEKLSIMQTTVSQSLRVQVLLGHLVDDYIRIQGMRTSISEKLDKHFNS